MTTQNQTPAQLSDAAASAIEALTYATRVEFPDDAFATVINLASLADCLPRLLNQIEELLSDLGYSLSEVHTGFLQAASAAADLSRGLVLAQVGFGSLVDQD